MNQHGTALYWNGHGIILTGPPCCGKSTLAMALINHGAELIADDQILISKKNDEWIATCPGPIRNQIFLRDQGIMHIPARDSSTIDFIFSSSLPADRLSQPPELGLTFTCIDFMDKNAAEFIRQTLMSAPNT